MDVVLYGHPDKPSRGSAGANIREAVRRLELKPAARAWDILSIALAVIAADTAVRRNESPDGWTRQIDLQVALGDPAFWSSQTLLLTAILRFLTTDIWNLTFLDKGVVPVPPKRAKMPLEDCVSLLSGGLDSLVGALDLTTRHKKKPYLVSQVALGDKEKQTYFASKIAGGLSHLQLNHVVTCPGENERSQRARSLIFLAYGVLLATTLRRYHEGKPVTLYVCENGLISINPPLTPGRLGSLSTRTTHPEFLGLFQSLLDAARLNIRIENPYQFKTKGAMLAECSDQAFLGKHAHLTTSCGRYARNGFRHCGRCVPCLIRRASFLAWKKPDKTVYVYEDLSKDDDDHAGFDDVRSAAMAVAAIQLDGLDRWLGSSLSSRQIADTTLYKQVVASGLDELKAFLRRTGVK
ncbi:MAG TPA: Qat anti-phage system QueC-like protein QatC [Steroidobacteraceae bacterium]|nr:Qat anti-phage system QueC-like protein QatC [Steroidobacteraceae bacterium]